MRITKETVAVLQNFYTINPSIQFQPGNVLRTVSTTESIFATATVAEEFPQEAALYDLSKFLGLLSLNKEDSEVEFKDKYLEIRQGHSKIKYSYCSADLIMTPPKGKSIKLKDNFVQFELKRDVFNGLVKAMSILGFSEVAVVGSNGVLSLQTLSSRTDEGDSYSTELGETDKEFFALFDAEKLKLIQDDYLVSISEKGISHFKGSIAEYWITLQSDSKFE